MEAEEAVRAGLISTAATAATITVALGRASAAITTRVAAAAEAVSLQPELTAAAAAAAMGVVRAFSTPEPAELGLSGRLMVLAAAAEEEESTPLQTVGQELYMAAAAAAPGAIQETQGLEGRGLL